MRIDIKRFDIYRKIPKDLTEPTYSGAIISICCTLTILLLLILEFNAFISPEIVSELFVENVEPLPSSKIQEKIKVYLNISLPNLECKYVGLDIQDDGGRHEVGFVDNTKKNELNGGKGCNFEASFQINKVPGNFHVSTHSAERQPDMIDMSHVIHDLTFGEDISDTKIEGSFNALKFRSKLDGHSLETHEYHMKIVPTIYEDGSGNRRDSFQYTYAYKSYLSFTHTGKIIPAIWFRYDLNPITVKYHKNRKPLYQFLTTISAIVGGVFTVAGIIDSLIFTASNVLKKLELGKLS